MNRTNPYPYPLQPNQTPTPHAGTAVDSGQYYNTSVPVQTYPQTAMPPQGYPSSGDAGVYYVALQQQVTYVQPLPTEQNDQHDEERGCCDFKPQESYEDPAIRRGFIRKVFGILAAQLLLTCGIVALFMFVDTIRRTVLENKWILVVSIGLELVVVLVLFCCTGVARKFPINMILLFVFTALEGVLIGAVTVKYTREEILMALGITVGVTLSVSVFALQTKWDFTVMGGALFIVTMVLFLAGILIAILGAPKIVGIAYASLGALLFSLWLLYDIQSMMAGKREQISPEDYVLAVLTIYIDIILIFQFVLDLIEYC